LFDERDNLRRVSKMGGSMGVHGIVDYVDTVFGAGKKLVLCRFYSIHDAILLLIWGI
jgi:hypothetical protein